MDENSEDLWRLNPLSAVLVAHGRKGKGIASHVPVHARTGHPLVPHA